MFANTFDTEIFDSTSNDLPQKVEHGDASENVGTNSLQVWGTDGTVEEIIEAVRLSTGAITPNDDGINDELTIEYDLFRLPQAVPVELSIYRLDGARAARIDMGLQRAGSQRIEWDGRDGDGNRLPPGLYLLELRLRTEWATVLKLQPIGIAY